VGSCDRLNLPGTLLQVGRPRGWVRLNLERYESVFVVVNPSAQPQHHLTETNADELSRSATVELE